MLGKVTIWAALHKKVPNVRKPQRLTFPQKWKFNRLKNTSLFSKSVELYILETT